MFTKIKSYAQATGWVGFLIGLIHKLGSNDDPATFGTSAAVGIATVLYGTINACCIRLPIST